MLVVDLHFDGVDTGEWPSPPAAYGNARVQAALERWQKNLWRPYADGRNPARVLRFTVVLPGHDGAEFERVEVTLVSNEGLFEQILYLAAELGQPGLSGAMQAVVTAHAGLTYQTRQIFLSSIDAVERLVAAELQIAEAAASRKALLQTRALNEANATFRRLFSDLTSEGETWKSLWLPGTQKADLFEKLLRCRGHRRKIEALAAEIETLDRKDGATPAARRAARSRDAYRQLRLDIYAGPQRAEIVALEQLQAEIFDLFPPALGIMGSLDADLAGWVPLAEASPGSIKDQSKLHRKYDQLLWAVLQEQTTMVGLIDRSLAAAGVETWAAAYFKLDLTDRIKAGGLTGHLVTQLLAPSPGIGDLAQALVMSGAVFGAINFLDAREGHLDENRVMARVPLLDHLAVEVGADETSALHAALLRSFLRDLQREARRQMIQQRDSDRMWHRVEMTLTFCGLVVGLVTLPFGAGEAILPASLAVWATIGGVALLVGTVVILTRSILVALSGALQADATLRDRLIEIGQQDPEALEELGAFILSRRELAASLTRTVVEELAEMAVQRLLPPLAFAIDLRDHFQAMDSLSVGLFDGDPSEEAI